MSASAAALRVRVASKQQEALDICTFELVRQDGLPLPPFAAGSHVDVHLPGGLVRQYSLCHQPSERHRYLTGVLRDANSRGGSQTLHDRVRVGDLLNISAPKNHFALAHGAQHSILLAGGIGVTPILCSVRRNLACMSTSAAPKASWTGCSARPATTAGRPSNCIASTSRPTW